MTEMSGGGMMGDAESIKFIFGKDTAEKIQARAELLQNAVKLPLETKIELIGVLYGLGKDEILREMNGYIVDNFPTAVDAPVRDKFNAWWQGIIAREKRDLEIVIMRLRGGR